MPAKSKSQQKLMAMALAYKREELKNASDEVKELAKNMSEKDLEDFTKNLSEDKMKNVKKIVLKQKLEKIKTILENQLNEDDLLRKLNSFDNRYLKVAMLKLLGASEDALKHSLPLDNKDLRYSQVEKILIKVYNDILNGVKLIEKTYK